MIGRTISHYRITGQLGGGNMGVVYKGEHTRVPLSVAIKLISDNQLGDARARERFLREAEAVATLDHPNVCRFHEIGETAEGRLFIVMQHCGGGTLATRLRGRPLPIADAVQIAAAVADGLDHAHRKKIIHRDIKPANLMFTADGQVKIGDFGLALLTDQTQLSKSGTTVGTFLYMSPEQLSTSRVDGRSDIFALGSVLYEMLAGEAPFRADNPKAIVYRILSEPHSPLRERRPEVPVSLEEIVARALEKDSARRYQTAAELRDDLLAVLARIAPERLRPGGVPSSPGQAHLRIAVAAALVVALSALGVWKRESIAGWLGLRPVESVIAVIAPAADEGAGDASIIAAGFATDLGLRIQSRSDRATPVWVIPPRRLRQNRVRGEDDAAGLVGADRIIMVRADPMSNGTVMELERFDAASPPVSRASSRIDLSAQHVDVDGALSQLLDMKPPRRAATLSPDAYRRFLIGLGYMSVERPDYEAAGRTLAEAVTFDSTFARAWAALGEARRQWSAQSGDSALAGEARAACRRALRLDDTMAAPHVTLARMYADGHRPDDAIRELESALRVSPRDAEALGELAEIYESSARKQDAEAVYARAARINPRDLDAHEFLGYFYYMHQRYEEAIAQFDRNRALAPDYAQTYNYLGACYFALDCWADAMVAFERSFALRRSFAACSNLGTLYYMDQRFEDAARMYEWAKEYRTNHETTAFLAAAYHWVPARRARSDSLYVEAIALAEAARLDAPRNAHLLAELAGFRAMVQPDSTEALADRAVALAPAEPRVLYQSAIAYELIGKRGKALVVLERAISAGCSLRLIAGERFLEDLRKDSRYELVLKGVKRPTANCSRTS